MDKKCPLNIYIEGGIFIEPFITNNYKETLGQIEKRYRVNVESLKNTALNKTTKTPIFDKNTNAIKIFDVALDRLCVNKKSYLSFQFFLKQSEALDIKNFAKENGYLINELCDSIKDDLLFFGFRTSKTKNQNYL